MDNSETLSIAIVKWYDRDRRYGFLVTDGGDVFVPWVALRRNGIRPEDLRDGRRVFYSAETRPGLRPEAITIRLAA